MNKFMLCYVMLCCVMLCYVMLCYVMLCYVMLCYVMLCYVMLCYVMLCYVMLCYVMLCYVIARAPIRYDCAYILGTHDISSVVLRIRSRYGTRHVYIKSTRTSKRKIFCFPC